MTTFHDLSGPVERHSVRNASGNIINHPQINIVMNKFNKRQPSEFDEFFALINTTAARKMNAQQVKEFGYIKPPQNPPSGNYKHKPSKKNKCTLEWERKIEEHRQRVIKRDQIT